MFPLDQPSMEIIKKKSAQLRCKLVKFLQRFTDDIVSWSLIASIPTRRFKLNSLNTQKKKIHDIWHWKSMSWLGTGTKMWQDLNQLLGSHDPTLTLPSGYLDNLDHFQRNVNCNYVEIEWEHIMVSMTQCRIKYVILVKFCTLYLYYTVEHSWQYFSGEHSGPLKYHFD